MTTAKVDELIAKLRAMPFSESAPGGGWARVSREKVGVLAELFRAIVDETSARDADGDATIEVTLTDRQLYRRPAAWVTEPYNWRDTAEGLALYTRAATALIGTGNDMLRMVSNELDDKWMLERERKCQGCGGSKTMPAVDPDAETVTDVPCPLCQ